MVSDVFRAPSRASTTDEGQLTELVPTTIHNRDVLSAAVRLLIAYWDSIHYAGQTTDERSGAEPKYAGS